MARHIFGEELQRNLALQLQVFGTTHHTHSAPAKLLKDAIVRNDLIQHRRCTR